MSPEAQRKAIAHARGLCTHGPNFLEHEGPEGDRRLQCKICKTENITPPDYLNDLNEWHRMEADMFPEEAEQFQQALSDVIGPWKNGVRNWFWHASAAQKSEAFLKSIGKWEARK